MMMIIMMLMRMMTMMQMMKHCEGLLREETRKACDENSLEGGHGTGHSEQSGNIWIRKKSTPTISMDVHHVVHLNSHLEIYIVRHTHRAGEKNTINVSTNSNLFLRYLWMLEPDTFIAPVGTWKMDVEKSEFQVE